MNPVDQTFLRSLPKAELHLHLTGAVRAATFVALAARAGVAVPGHREPADLYDISDMRRFLAVYEAIGQSLRSAADFHRIVYEAVEDLAASGVRYTEIFFSPSASMAMGVPYPDLLDGMRQGLRDAEHDFNVIGRLIVAHNRELGAAAGLELLDTVLAHRVDELLGLGLDFSELQAPPALFTELFARARRAGLKVTAHAGEEGPGANVRDALLLLECDRIDHGYRVTQHAEAVRLARSRNTYFTVCPTTMNMIIGTTDVHADPMRRMDEAGIPYVIGSDDPPMLRTTLLNEYGLVHAKLGFDRRKFASIALNGVKAAWLDEATRREWLSRWTRDIEELLQ